MKSNLHPIFQEAVKPMRPDFDEATDARKSFTDAFTSRPLTDEERDFVVEENVDERPREE